MRAAIESVIESLRSLKRDGMDRVYVRSESLQALSRAVERYRRDAEVPAAPAAAEPPESAADNRVMHAELPAAAEAKPAGRNKPAADKAVDSAPAIPAPPVIELPQGDKQSRWEWLRERVLNCPVCQSHVASGKKVVFGTGSLDAGVFFCGEAPGAEEEIQGEPFVGPAGELLTRIIQAMGLQRESVYIGNIMNWRPAHSRPTGNRPPTMEEMSFCLPYLRAQIDVVQPKVIIALGATATQGLLNQQDRVTMGRVRGKWQAFEDIPMMPTYHPSYLLHNDTLRSKRMVWEDMLAVMDKLGMPVSTKQRGYFLSNKA